MEKRSFNFVYFFLKKKKGDSRASNYIILCRKLYTNRKGSAQSIVIKFSLKIVNIFLFICSLL